MIHFIQTIHFVHKAWWKSQSYFMLIQMITAFLEATLWQRSVQANYLKRRIWGDSRPVRPRLYRRCGGWDGPIVLHVVQPVPEGLNGISCRGRRYKVIHFLMPFKQGSQLADRRPQLNFLVPCLILGNQGNQSGEGLGKIRVEYGEHAALFASLTSLRVILQTNQKEQSGLFVISVSERDFTDL